MKTSSTLVYIKDNDHIVMKWFHPRLRLIINVVGGQSPQESVVSAIYQASRHHDEENDDPNESSDWLHRNDEYVRRQRPPLTPLQTESSNGIVINTGPIHLTKTLYTFLGVEIESNL